MFNPLDQFIVGPLTGELELERYVIRIDAPVETVYEIIGGYGTLRDALGMKDEPMGGASVDGSLFGYRFAFPDRFQMEKGDEITLRPFFESLVIGFEVTKADEGRRIRLKYTEGPLAGKLTWTVRPDPENDNRTELEFIADCSIEAPLFRLVWLFFFQWVHYFVIGMMLLQIRRAAEKKAILPVPGDPVHG